MSMYEILREAHSGWRYLVILVGLIAVIRMLIGWFTSGAWSTLDRRLGTIFVSVLDIQVLLGLVLWIMLPGWSLGPSAPAAYEHPVTMILAVAVAHGSWSMARRREPDTAKFRIAAIGFIVSAILIALGVTRIAGGLFS
jgi:hypothetical protein